MILLLGRILTDILSTVKTVVVSVVNHFFILIPLSILFTPDN